MGWDWNGDWKDGCGLDSERRDKFVVTDEVLRFDCGLTFGKFQLPSFLPCASLQAGLQFSFYCSLFLFCFESMDKFHKSQLRKKARYWKMCAREKSSSMLIEKNRDLPNSLKTIWSLVSMRSWQKSAKNQILNLNLGIPSDECYMKKLELLGSGPTLASFRNKVLSSFSFLWALISFLLFYSTIQWWFIMLSSMPGTCEVQGRQRWQVTVPDFKVLVCSDLGWNDNAKQMTQKVNSQRMKRHI